METIPQQPLVPQPDVRAALPGTRRAPWLAAAGLIALSVVPLGAGVGRLAEVAAGTTVTADNARFIDTPLPVVVHVVGAIAFCVLGALQFVPALRQRRWHRMAGRVALPAGMVVALSGLWMTFFYALPAGENDTALKVLRLVFGVGMLLALVNGARAVLRRDLTRHRAWMRRGYAIGLGAGTQALLMIPWALLLGRPVAPARTVLMAAGWLVNLVVAEGLEARARRRAGRPKAERGRDGSASSGGRA